MPGSRNLIALKVDIRSKMGEIIRGKRQHDSGFDKVDDEIYIKRPRFNSEGDSNDSSGDSNDSSDNGFIFATLLKKQVIDHSRSDKVTVQTVDETVYYACESKVQKVTLKSKMDEQKLVEAASASSKHEKEDRDLEDTREMNRRSPNGFLLPDPLPRGERLRDTMQQEWVLGPAIGLGGFGELYSAAKKLKDGSTSPQHYVIKVEPHSNGPLFVEIHFYLQATRADQLDTFRTSRGLRHLGVPRYIASGSHSRGAQKYRFLVMEKFGSDLQRILDHSEGGRFNDKTVCEVALQVLDSLEFIHSQGYVHKDVKASNLLVGLGQQGQHLIHLVDYGLCSKFTVGGLHKQYIHDLRWAHEGTLEYTSRDAHIGSASRRGDIEVLLYNLVEWWGGRLPWDRDLASPDLTKVAKFRAFANPHKFLRCCFSRQGCATYPPLLLKLMKYVSGLHFEEEPDYNLMRTLIKQEMSRLGCRQDGRLEFRLGPNAPDLTATASEESLVAEFLRPLPAANGGNGPSPRVSGVFDRMCVSERSWQEARQRLTTRRDKDSLANPTQAMVDIIEKMKSKPVQTNRKRTKSGAWHYGDGPTYTPAMLEVIKLQQLRRSGDMVSTCSPTKSDKCGQEELEDPNPVAASLLPPRVLPSRSPIPVDIVLSRPASPPQVAAEKLRIRRQLNGKKELARLDTYLPDPEPRRRTRSADVTDAEVARNLRSGFRFGLGNMTRALLRQVSDSLTRMF